MAAIIMTAPGIMITTITTEVTDPLIIMMIFIVITLYTADISGDTIPQYLLDLAGTAGSMILSIIIGGTAGITREAGAACPIHIITIIHHRFSSA